MPFRCQPEAGGGAKNPAKIHHVSCYSCLTYYRIYGIYYKGRLSSEDGSARKTPRKRDETMGLRAVMAAGMFLATGCAAQMIRPLILPTINRPTGSGFESTLNIVNLFNADATLVQISTFFGTPTAGRSTLRAAGGGFRARLHSFHPGVRPANHIPSALGTRMPIKWTTVMPSSVPPCRWEWRPPSAPWSEDGC